MCIRDRFLLVGFAAITLAACSSDNDSASDATTTTTAAPLTPTEFKAQGNAICKKGGEDIGALFADNKDPNTLAPAAKQERFDQVIAITRRQIDDLSALAAPADLKPQVEALTTDATAKTDELVAGGPDALFASEGDPFASLNPKFQALGLTGCVSGN